MEGGDGEPGHRAGSDDERLGLLERADVGHRRGERGVEERLGDAVERGLGVGPLADAQRLLEGAGEVAGERTGVLRGGEGLAELAEDLRLAERHRVEAGGKGEEVLHRLGVEVHVDVVGELVPGQSDRLDERGAEVGEAAVERLDVGDELEPVAGGEHGRPAHVLPRPGAAEERVDPRRIEGQRVEDRHGR